MIAALVLTGCGGFKESGKTEPPKLGSIPAKFKKPCDPPSAIPDGRLPQKKAETLWGKDRAALVKCNGTKQGLVKFIEDRDRRLGGDK